MVTKFVMVVSAALPTSMLQHTISTFGSTHNRTLGAYVNIINTIVAGLITDQMTISIKAEGTSHTHHTHHNVQLD